MRTVTYELPLVSEHVRDEFEFQVAATTIVFPAVFAEVNAFDIVVLDASFVLLALWTKSGVAEAGVANASDKIAATISAEITTAAVRRTQRAINSKPP